MYTKGGTIVGHECTDSTMINGCSGMRPFLVYENVIDAAKASGGPLVLTFQTPEGSTGDSVLSYFQEVDDSAKASTFWPMASNRVVDHNGNPMQIMRTGGTMISDFMKALFNLPDLSNKDQRLISVKHKENVHFGLTKYKSQQIQADAASGNAKIENIYFLPDFWKNPESEGVLKLDSQPVKGNRPDALGILNYGAGCHRDLFGPANFFLSDTLDAESEQCQALRTNNDFKDIETEIEMDTLISLVSAVDEHLISRKRKTFCDWMFFRTPKGEKYIDPKSGKTIYLDISASYDFTSEEDNVIMEVPVTDGSDITGTTFLKLLKIETGKTTNRASANGKIVIKRSRHVLHDIFVKDNGELTYTESKAAEFDTSEACESFRTSTQGRDLITNGKLWKHRWAPITPYKLFWPEKNYPAMISDLNYGDYECTTPAVEVSKLQITVEVLEKEQTEQVYKMFQIQ